MIQYPISVYASNLERRVDRKVSIKNQFSGKEEFALTVVPAIEHENGAWGQWQTFFRIVEEETVKNSPFFIFCEDDHIFTENYNVDLLQTCISEADALGADMLSGGMSWLRHPVQVSERLFKVEAFNGMQFVVVYNRFYSTILSYRTHEGYVTDKFLSEVSDNIFVIYPFVSTQRDFGYSDVTSRNNQVGRVPALFRNMAAWLGRLDKVRMFYRKAAKALPEQPRDMDDISLPTYIIHLPEHTDRKHHLEEQFAGRREFDVRWVDACRHKSGAVGLWNSIRKIVEQAEQSDEDVILVCEDDHTFTPQYDREHFMRQVWTAGMMGTQILMGGIGGFGCLVPVRDGIYWADWIWCTQFTVIYRRAFPLILQARFAETDVADEFLSRLLPNKLVIFPFISEQRDFGYSDVTLHNNASGRISEYFRRSRQKAMFYMGATLRYNVAENMQPSPRDRQMFSALAQCPHKKLHIGCGPNILEGWLNTDANPGKGAFYMDAGQPFPFSDSTFDFIFSEHLFEHLTYEAGKSMLEECHRVLKSGGVLRLTMPSLEFLIKLYNEPQKEEHQRYAAWSLQQYAPKMYADFAAGGRPLPMAFVVNNFMRLWGHQMLYDRSSLHTMLERSGFKNITAQQNGMSKYVQLCGVECHGRIIPDWANRLESMTVEAEK